MESTEHSIGWDEGEDADGATDVSDGQEEQDPSFSKPRKSSASSLNTSSKKPVASKQPKRKGGVSPDSDDDSSSGDDVDRGKPPAKSSKTPSSKPTRFSRKEQQTKGEKVSTSNDDEFQSEDPVNSAEGSAGEVGGKVNEERTERNPQPESSPHSSSITPASSLPSSEVQTCTISLRGQLTHWEYGVSMLLPSETSSTTTSLDGLVGPFEVANHINRRKGRTPDQPPSTLVDPAFPPPPPTSLSPSWPVPPLKASRTCLVFYHTNNIMGIGWRITRGDPREGGPPDWFRAPLGTYGDVHPVYATISQGHPRLSPPQSTLGRRSSSTTAAAHTTRLLHLASTRSSSTTATAPCDATARGVSSCRSTAALLQSDEDGMARRHRHSLPPLLRLRPFRIATSQPRQSPHFDGRRQTRTAKRNANTTAFVLVRPLPPHPLPPPTTQPDDVSQPAIHVTRELLCEGDDISDETEWSTSYSSQ
ncbi:hypothetical protein GALMADRAFT_147357 [Galerina marginata CBS 339.88]|uniref:Uncharacterized protein n=1 Tax=Galerina marginata (strain CBS 339.88) TaxID=685588 RepID=A0A067SHE4_GALM3|nr:hypothetical protein GALMADRAFT_147357 [Galerina marginata CBS 339.88]